MALKETESLRNSDRTGFNHLIRLLQSMSGSCPPSICNTIISENFQVLAMTAMHSESHMCHGQKSLYWAAVLCPSIWSWFFCLVAAMVRVPGGSPFSQLIPHETDQSKVGRKHKSVRFQWPDHRNRTNQTNSKQVSLRD